MNLSREGELKFRNIVSFKGHPVQADSRIMSRSLQTALNFRYEEIPTFVVSSLLGVRDTLTAQQRLRAIPAQVHLLEKDMADTFWAIPVSEAIAAVDWLFTFIAKKKRMCEITFSISREGKALDRVGLSTQRSFMRITGD